MNNDTKNTVLDTPNETAEGTASCNKKNNIKNKMAIRRLTAVAVVIVLLGIITFNILPIGELFELDKGEGSVVTVEIPQGANADQIADILIEKGVVESKLAFKLKLKFYKNANELKYGKYKLNTSMTLSQVIDELSGGRQEGMLITVPEGYSAEMIAELCEEKGICTGEEFLDALTNEAFDYEFLENIPENPQLRYRLQGFLFPDTYEYNATTTAVDLINTMLKTYEKNIHIPTNGELDYYEVLTLASIVEREAKIDGERSKIAGVFMNRLRIDMPLQACATVIYAKSEGAYDMDTVLYSDLEVDSPYNTYKNPGLPAGPICNPGVKAVEAVLNPEKHSYLYYHTDENKKDGSHIFTQSFTEHSMTQK